MRSLPHSVWRTSISISVSMYVCVYKDISLSASAGWNSETISTLSWWGGNTWDSGDPENEQKKSNPLFDVTHVELPVLLDPIKHVSIYFVP